MYIDSNGFYGGLDKLDTAPGAGSTLGASYFYPNIVSTNPNYTAFAAGTIEGSGCNGTLAAWEI
jgi:hypothetical protein